MASEIKLREIDGLQLRDEANAFSKASADFERTVKNKNMSIPLEVDNSAQRILLGGFNAYVVDALRKNFEVFWVSGSKNADLVHDWRRHEFKLTGDVDWASLQQVLTILMPKADQIYECYARHFYAFSPGGSGLSIHDYSNLLLSHTIKVLQLFQEFRPTHLILSNIPHEGFSNVIWEVGQFFNVKSYKFFQTPCGPKHWVLRDTFSSAFTKPIGACGFDNAEGDKSLERFFDQLEGRRTYKYMRDLQPLYIPKLTYVYPFTLARNLITALSWNRVRVQLYQAYQDLLVLNRQRKYRRSVRTAAKPLAQLDLKKGYGLFSLHLQPELTTSALGKGFFHNQLLAVKLFAGFCHKNGLLCVVKENPKQNFSHRSEHFFEALASIANVYLVDIDAPNQQLVGGAAVVATITGTVGIEALLQSKPVVCFGDAWFGSIEGVVAPENMTASIFELEICPNRVKAEIAKLYAHAQPGVVNNYYLDEWAVDVQENNRRVHESIEKILGEAD